MIMENFPFYILIILHNDVTRVYSCGSQWSNGVQQALLAKHL